MKKKILVLVSLVVALATLLIGCTGGYASIPKDHKFVLDDSWEQTFCDDFDTLNLDNWKVNTMPNNHHVRGAAYYTDSDDVLFTKDGNLVMRTLYKTSEYGTGWHTSWLESSVVKGHLGTDNPNYKGLSQTYGYFEIRCQVPASYGIWSAFWMMPDGAKGMTSEDIQGTGSDGVEIDIMESPYMYHTTKNLNTHVVHGEGYGGNLTSDRSINYYVPNMYTKFHTYSLEWNETEYIFYIDGYETYRTKYCKYDDEGNITSVLGVSKVPQFLIMSVEVGGDEIDGVLVPGKKIDSAGNITDNWCGSADKNNKKKSYDFIVDYVKAYSKK